MDSLFGDNFSIEIKKPKTKSLIDKIKNEELSNADISKAIKSKTVSLNDKLKIIKDKVYKTLGKQINNVLVIKDIKSFDKYISKAIIAGRIAIDTETNNSLDPVTCKIMGLCLYVPGEKQAYIPVNHINNETGEKLAEQITENQIREELQRIKDNHTVVVMHNGKFDYEVIKCTCGIEIPPDWDTMIAARLINENEPAGLKYQYIHYIDPSQEKYDIEELFSGVEYAQVDPNIFALYSATDSLMTDKLYIRQKEIFDREENKRLFWVFKNIEMPNVQIIAEMELTGCAVDLKYGERLHKKYDKSIKEVDSQVNVELNKLKPIIDSWKLTKEANEKTKQYVSKNTSMTQEKIAQMYPFVDEEGKRYKTAKSKVEQLEDPINMSSPTQLAILFYDILKVNIVNKKSPRGTGEEELKAIAEQNPNLTICNLLMKRRELLKLMTTYIETIPKLAKHWPDGRVRAHINQLGTDTGRVSSGGKVEFMENGKQVIMSGINQQNIPSGSPDIRLLFQATYKRGELESKNNIITLPEITEIETTDGYKFGKDLKIGDSLITDEGNKVIKDIKYNNKIYYITI